MIDDDQAPARVFTAVLVALAVMLGAALYVTSREPQARAAREFREDLHRATAIHTESGR